MKKIFIDESLVNFKNDCSFGLISGLKRLYLSDFDLYSNNTNPLINEILKSEGIKLQNAALNISEGLIVTQKNDKVHIDNDKQYNNFNEFVDELISLDRTSRVERKTKETEIKLEMNIDGSGIFGGDTGIGFFNHMLEQISRHGNIDLKLEVNGDLNVDEHHTVEDVGLVFGECLNKTLGSKSGIKRFGFMLPMDDSIASCAVDLGGRPFLNFNCKFNRETVGDFPTELTEEFFKSVSQSLGANIFIKAEGKNDHHKIESIFKAFAKAINEALRIDERAKGNLPTTKGAL